VGPVFSVVDATYFAGDGVAQVLRTEPKKNDFATWDSLR
jgi:hypothetical protein